MSGAFDKDLPAESMDLIDTVCDEFESQWILGERPRITTSLPKSKRHNGPIFFASCCLLTLNIE